MAIVHMCQVSSKVQYFLSETHSLLQGHSKTRKIAAKRTHSKTRKIAAESKKT
jgi:predicted glycosyl hydrolase (DUF1957 family)